jgi:DNA polymerase-3 subunit alpha
MKYPGYFLIVADFIQWAKSRGIPVGPGRGSGAGSLVAYALTITDLDPDPFRPAVRALPQSRARVDAGLRHRLLSGPRYEVIDYVQGRYGPRSRSGRSSPSVPAGARRAARRRTRARNALRTGRQALQAGADESGRAGDARARDRRGAAPAGARDAEPVVRRAFDIAKKLEGLHRHASTHAAGIVIGDRPLAELVPMYRDPKSTCR